MNTKAEADAARALAYRIAGALQAKLKDTLVGVRIEYLPICERLIVEYTLTDGGRVSSSTAYSQSYFEDTSKEHDKWLATQIYIQLKQRLEWLLSGKTNAHSTHASDRSERYNADSIPRTGVVQDRRRKGTRSRQPSVKKDAANSQPIHTEQVPASAIEGA